jgi:indolepyruvate ferredoxin oxidoreductase beta subunit
MFSVILDDEGRWMRYHHLFGHFLKSMVGQLHGMSQRGGSVECSVLIGPGHSSFIGDGEADVILGLEPLEVQRALPRMSADTRVVVNLGVIVPFSLAVAGQSYPAMDSILARVRQVTTRVFEVDGPGLVQRTGLPRTLNVVMLGALTGLDMLPFPEEVVWQTLEKKIPQRFLEANRTAFELGLQAVRSRPSAGGASG